MIIDKYNKITREFIWSKKRAKISLARLQNPMTAGGLKLVDLAIKDKSIKIAMFKKIVTTEHTVGKCILAKLARMPIEMLEKSNLSANDILKSKNHCVYRDIITNWCNINYYTPQGRLDVMRQSLWYNSHIKVNNQPYSVSKEDMKIIQNIESIINVNEWLTYPQLKEKYPELRMNFLQYKSLLSAIPKEWKKLLRINNPVTENFAKKCETTNKVAKMAYEKILQKQPKVDDKYRYKWEQILRTEIPDKEWQEGYAHTKRLTLSTKLRLFQYKLNNFAIITNINLCK